MAVTEAEYPSSVLRIMQLFAEFFSMAALAFARRKLAKNVKRCP